VYLFSACFNEAIIKNGRVKIETRRSNRFKSGLHRWWYRFD